MTREATQHGANGDESQRETDVSDRVLLTVDDDGVAHVRLNRPDKMNALDPDMFDALRATGARLQALPGLRAVVLSGEGRAFCAGLDFGRFQKMGEGGAAVLPGPDLRLRTHGLANAPQQVAWLWHELPVPVIAAVQGVAFGGGLQIALGADVRFVTAQTKMSVMEIKWGLVPDMAGMVLMRQLLRGDVMRELTYSGRIVPGTEAVAIGLATRLCEDPLAEAISLARQIAGSSPDAIRAAKRLLNQSASDGPAAILQAESDEQARLIGSANQIEAARAGLEKRAPVFVDASAGR